MNSSPIEETASAWLARRDRGFSPGEQDEFLQWLRDDPRHAEAFTRMEQAWERLDVLKQWRPQHASQPNPDLLAVPAQSRRPYPLHLLVWGVATLAAAAAVILVFLPASRDRSPAGAAILSSSLSSPPPGLVRRAPSEVVLPDGSVVARRDEAHIDVGFEPDVRRVQVVEGEAHFAVAENPARPFVVDTGAVSVRAVGTAFSVRKETGRVTVLVEEGRVRITRMIGMAAGSQPTSSLLLDAGQRVRLDLDATATAPVVETLSPAEVEQALAWQRTWLEFSDLPLADVAGEFNRYNHQKLIVGDAATGAFAIGGTFRADQVDAFVRLLGTSFGISSDRRDDATIVLTLRR